MATFKVSGVKAIEKAFDELEKKIANKVIRQGLRAGAKPIQAEVKARAPRGKTKKLARAVKVKAGKRKKNTIRIKIELGEGAFKGRTFYGAFVDLGTVKQAAQNFMLKSFKAKAEQAKETAVHTILAGTLREVAALKGK